VRKVGSACKSAVFAHAIEFTHPTGGSSIGGRCPIARCTPTTSSLGILAADERSNRSIFHERFAVLNTHDGVCSNSLAAPTPAGSTPLADSATGRN
jgi:hypothetical protein